MSPVGDVVPAAVTPAADVPPGPGRRVRHPVFGVAAVTAVSQATSALGLVAMPLLGLGTADTYAVGLQVGYASLNGLVIGVVFNYSIGRVGATHWAAGRIAGIAVAVVVTGAVLLWRVADGADGVEVAVLGTFGFGGAVLAVAGVAAVEVACRGRPLVFAGLSIAPNTALLAGVLVGAAVGGVPGLVLPAAVWAAGCSIAALAARAALGAATRERPPAHQPVPPGPAGPAGPAGSAGPAGPAGSAGSAISDRHHLAGLVLGVGTSALVPTLLVLPLTQLGTGVTTVLFLISRIGASLVGVGVNSLLLTRYHWGSHAQPLGDRLWPAAAVAAVVLAVADTVGVSSAAASLPAHLGLGLGWVVMLALAAVVLRETNAARRGRTLLIKATVDLVVSVAATAVFLAHPSVSGFFGVYTLSAATTVALCSRGPRTALAAVAVGVGAAAAVLPGW